MYISGKVMGLRFKRLFFHSGYHAIFGSTRKCKRIRKVIMHTNCIACPVCASEPHISMSAGRLHLASRDIKSNRRRIVILEIRQRRISHSLHLERNRRVRRTGESRNVIGVTRGHRRSAIIRQHLGRIGKISTLSSDLTQTAEIYTTGARECV